MCVCVSLRVYIGLTTTVTNSLTWLLPAASSSFGFLGLHHFFQGKASSRSSHMYILKGCWNFPKEERTIVRRMHSVFYTRNAREKGRESYLAAQHTSEIIEEEDTTENGESYRAHFLLLPS